MVMEVVIASSPVDAGIGCWDLRTGAEHLRYRSCASPPNGLISVSGGFLASSQLRESSSSSSGSIFFWSWDKPQVEIRSFPPEPIIPLVSNSNGTYIIGGGASGNIYFWEVASGRLLKKWQAHYRPVTSMAFSDDESFLISGAEDGCVRVWSLLMMFDDMANVATNHTYQYSFFGHSLRVTDVISGHGLCNSIAISSSEDRTCKIWSLSKGKLLRSITFPSIIYAVAIDPGEHAFYAGGRDGKIYIAALNAESTSSSSYGMHIIGSLFDHGKAINCLAFSIDGFTLVSGSEDGIVRVWDTKNQHVIRIFKHAKGPVNNVFVVRLPQHASSQSLVNDGQVSSRKRIRLSMPPPLEKYTTSMDGDVDTKSITSLQPSWNEELSCRRYVSSLVMQTQINELQQQGSSGAAEMELEKLKLECKGYMQMAQQWKNLYQDLQKVCVDELLVKGPEGDA